MVLSSAEVCFSKSTVLKSSFRNTIGVSNSLDPDEARHFVDVGSSQLSIFACTAFLAPSILATLVRRKSIFTSSYQLFELKVVGL